MGELDKLNQRYQRIFYKTERDGVYYAKYD